MADGGGVGERGGGRIRGGREGMVGVEGGLRGGWGRTKRGGWGRGGRAGKGSGAGSEVMGWRGEVGGEDMVMGSGSMGLGRRRLDDG